MDIRELRSLVTLARTGSMTRTAGLLHLTPSAIHRQLRILSEDLNLPVYERHDGGLRLTPGATALLPLIEDLLVQYDAVRAAAGDWNNLRRGAVRVGSGPTFASHALPPFLEAFRTRYSALDVFLEAGHTAQLLPELEDGSIDLVFLVPHPGIEKRFSVEAAWTFDVPLVTGPRYRIPGRVSLRSLAGIPFLLYRQGSYFEQVIDRYLAANNFAPAVAMRLDNAEPMKALVQSGFGISLLPLWAVRKELASGQLSRVRIKEAPLQARLVLIRRRSKYVPAPAGAMIEMAKTWNWKSVTELRPGRRSIQGT